MKRGGFSSSADMLGSCRPLKCLVLSLTEGKQFTGEQFNDLKSQETNKKAWTTGDWRYPFLRKRSNV
jgi:hypothetical protein